MIQVERIMPWHVGPKITGAFTGHVDWQTMVMIYPLQPPPSGKIFWVQSCLIINGRLPKNLPSKEQLFTICTILKQGFALHVKRFLMPHLGLHPSLLQLVNSTQFMQLKPPQHFAFSLGPRKYCCCFYSRNSTQLN